MTPPQNVVSFYSVKQAQENHQSRMRSRIYSVKRTVLRHHLSLSGGNSPNGRPIGSLRLSLAISLTAILHSKLRSERSLRTIPTFESALVPMILCSNPLSWSRLRTYPSLALFLS